MKQSDSIAKLTAALVKVQDHLTPVAKDRVNSHFKNRYATLDSIMESVRAPLAGVGLAIVQGGGAAVSNMNGDVVAVGVETMLVHESGEYVSSVITLPLAQASPQAVGSAVTYGRRYGVAALLALTTEEDDDGNHAQAVTQHAAPRVAVPARVLDKAGVVAALDMVDAGGALVREDGGGLVTNEHGDPVLAPGQTPECPVCGGGMWDDRTSKKNPSAPDFKCKNKPKTRGGPGCPGVIWPPKGEKAAPTRAAALAAIHDADEIPF